MKIFSGAKKLLKKITDAVKKFFAGEFAFLRKNSQLAVDITNKLKELVENPLANVVANLIPGNIDNELLYKIQKILPVVAAEMAIAHGILQASQNNTEAMQAITSYLKGRVKDARVGFWIEFSARLNQALADGKITFTEAVLLAQMVYANDKGEVRPA